MKEIIIALIPVLGTGLLAFQDIKRLLADTKKDIRTDMDLMRKEIIEIKKNQSLADWLTQIEHQMRTLVETTRPFFMYDQDLSKFVISFTDAFIDHVLATIKNIELFDIEYICEQGKIDKETVDKLAYQYLDRELSQKWLLEHTLKANELRESIELVIKDTVNHKKERVFFESFEFLKHMLSFLNVENKKGII